MMWRAALTRRVGLGPTSVTSPRFVVVCFGRSALVPSQPLAFSSRRSFAKERATPPPPPSEGEASAQENTPAEKAEKVARRPKRQPRREGELWNSETSWRRRKFPQPHIPPEHIITQAQLKQALAAKSAALLLDLRSSGECKCEPGIPSAINIPGN